MVLMLGSYRACRPMEGSPAPSVSREESQKVSFCQVCIHRFPMGFGNKDIKMIPVATEGSHSDDIIRALDNGEIVSVFADRFVNDKKLIISTIHGYKVKLARLCQHLLPIL